MSEPAPRQWKRVEKLLGIRWAGQASRDGKSRGACLCDNERGSRASLAGL